MERSKDTATGSRGLRVSIRDLLSLTSVIALALALYFSHQENSQLKAKLNAVFPRSHLRLDDDQPLETSYTVFSDISMTGQLYPVDHSATKAGIVVAKMIDPTNGNVLGTTTSNVNPLGSFGFTIKHSPDLEPGFYPVVVELFDGPKRVAFANSSVRLAK